MIYLIRATLMTIALAAGYVWLQPRDQKSQIVEVSFVEQAQDAGCLNVHSMVRLSDRFENIMPWLSSVGAAAAAGDYNGDGAVDLYVTNSGRGDSNRLFRNRGDGTFEDVTEVAGVGCGNPEGASMHAVWGDIDNDGDLDLYVVKWAEANTLFENRGDSTFAEISADAGVDYWGYGNAATFLDYDRDGLLDILLGNYFAAQVKDADTGEMVRNNLWKPVTTRVMHETFTHADNGGRNVLYRNLGHGRFEDVSKTVGMTFTGWTLSVGSGDLNNDGWPDLYLANDFGPDEYYLNTGATESVPRFRLVVDPQGHPGIGDDWWKGMNVDMGDVNNDGYLDIYVTNILERNYKTDEGNMLWLNRVDPLYPGGRRFFNIAQQVGTHDGGWGWGGKFADFNNDGMLDIYTVNGFVTGDTNQNYWYAIQEMVTQTKNQTANATDWPVMGTRDLSGHERGRLFMQVLSQDTNASEPAFVEMAERAGIGDLYNGRGIAVADFNLDGWLDMYIANQGAPSCYYVNRTGERGDKIISSGKTYVSLQLVGRPDQPVSVGPRRLASTVDAVGARVTLTTDIRQQMREVQGGMGFSSQSQHALHFGMRESETIQSIEIRWPSGRVQHFEAHAARDMLNCRVRIVEGSNDLTKL